jgi:hypothetical protein
MKVQDKAKLLNLRICDKLLVDLRYWLEDYQAVIQDMQTSAELETVTVISLKKFRKAIEEAIRKLSENYPII